MTRVVPVHFVEHEGHWLPMVDVTIKLRAAAGARLHERALLDTGSHASVFSRTLLRLHRFPVHKAKATAEGIHGIGGRVASFTLDEAIIGLRDTQGTVSTAKLARLHFVDPDMVTILGRDVLEAVGATLRLDFKRHDGHIELA